MAEDKQRVQCRVNSEVFDWIKQRALDEGLSINSVINQILHYEYLMAKQAEQNNYVYISNPLIRNKLIEHASIISSSISNENTNPLYGTASSESISNNNNLISEQLKESIVVNLESETITPISEPTLNSTNENIESKSTIFPGSSQQKEQVNNDNITYNLN